MEFLTDSASLGVNLWTSGQQTARASQPVSQNQSETKRGMKGREKKKNGSEGQEIAFGSLNQNQMPTSEKKSRRGGPRPGGGRPKGSLEIKARTLIEVKNRIAQKADDLLNAELVEGLGCNVILRLDPTTKKYEPVTDPDEILKVINEHRGGSGKVGDTHYIVAAQPGNYKSRQYLFDRAFGRPQQTVEVTADPEVVQLKNAIERRAQDKGITYEQELRLYIENFAHSVKPEIKEKLASELSM